MGRTTRTDVATCPRHGRGARHGRSEPSASGALASRRSTAALAVVSRPRLFDFRPGFLGRGSVRALSEIIKAPYEKAIRALNAFSPRTEFFSGRERFETIITEALRTVEKHRTERVNQLPLDQERLERLRNEAEAAILTEPVSLGIRGFKVQKSKSQQIRTNVRN
jgi:hypothetical protein